MRHYTIALALFLTFDVVEALDSLNVRTVGLLPYTAARYVYLDTTSRTLITGVGAGVYIHDVSSPATPVEIGRFGIPGIANAVARRGNYLYVAGYKMDLMVYDVSNPSRPYMVFAYDDPDGFSTDLWISSNYLYLADGSAGLLIFDLSMPDYPFLVKILDVVNPRRILVENDTLYVGRASSIPPNFIIYDVSDPVNPVEVGSLDSTDYVMGIAKRGNYVYLGVGYDGIMVVDVSDPTSPVAEGRVSLTGYVSRMSVLDTLMAVSAGYGGLYIMDISSGSSPSQVGHLDTYGLTSHAIFDGQYVYLADHYGGIGVVDVSDPTNPVVDTIIGVPGTNLDVAVSGDVAFVTGYYGYMRSIDLTDPSNPRDLAPWNNFQYGYKVAIIGDYAYVSAILLYIYDISDPSDIQLVGSYSPPSITRFVTADGNYLYVAAGDSGVVILDASNPTNPTRVATIQTGSTPVGVDVDGGRAYIIDVADNLTIWDVSNPAAPSLLGTMTIPGYGFYVLAAGDVAFVSRAQAGIISVDVSDPANPTILDSLDTSFARGLALKDTILAVADMGSGVKFVNVANPDSMVMIGYYLTPGTVYNVEFYGDYLLVPDYDGGFRILQYIYPVNASESVPDGYWRATVRGLRFEKEMPFQIYTLEGRLVRNGYAHPGMVLRLGPGVYVIRSPYGTGKVVVR